MKSSLRLSSTVDPCHLRHCLTFWLEAAAAGKTIRSPVFLLITTDKKYLVVIQTLCAVLRVLKSYYCALCTHLKPVRHPY